jgi:hypothetical protein
LSLTEEKIAELKERHGEGQLVAITVDSSTGEQVVIRRPSRAEWKKFRAHGSDDKRRQHAPENLVRECSVFPDVDRLNALLDRYPGLVETLTIELVQLAGMTDSPEKKVL